MHFAHVDEAGQITEIRNELPAAGSRWVEQPVMVDVLDENGNPTGEREPDPSGATERARATVSNFHYLPREILADEGWLPIEDEEPVYDPNTQQLVESGLRVETARVVRTWVAEYLPPALEAPVDTVAPADGATALTVTYRAYDPAITDVVFNVGGQEVAPTPVENGTAAVDVTAASPQTVTVAAPNTSPVGLNFT